MASPSTENAKDIYVELASIPTYSSGQFLSRNVISVTSAASDHARNAKRTSAKTFFVPSAAEDEVVASTPQDVSPEVRVSNVSSSGKLTAILRETDQGSKRFVEIWDNGKLLVSEDVTKLHGVFYTDDHFRSLAFSPSESAVVYTAEANAPGNNGDPYAKYRYTPDFGESLTDRKRPTLIVFAWGSIGGSMKGKAQLVAVPEVLSPVFFGQAVFSSSNGIIATGYKYLEDGQLLGIKGCWSRPTDIWELRLNLQFTITTDEDISSAETLTVTAWKKISDPERSSRSPLIHVAPESGKRTVFWLSNQLGGAHASCIALHSLLVQDSESKSQVLLGTIDKPSPSFMNGFAGLYTSGFGLPEHPFLHLRESQKPYIVTQTAEGSRTAVILIDTQQPSVVKSLTPKSEDAISSWIVLATDGKNQLLCTRSSPAEPQELLLGTVSAKGGDTEFAASWRVIDKPIISDSIREALGSLKTSIVRIPNREPTETILIEHKAKDNSGIKPLVTSVHGGPHGNSFTSFTPSITALALLGYTVSLPNYTGSLGFGDYYVKKLLGRCGSLDVEDVVESVRHLVKLGIAEENPKKQFVEGGSHGGFIGAHLVGHYPDLFGAAAFRNPVITGAAPSSTDIPDWYFYEFGVPFSQGAQITPDLYKKLWDASPIAYAEKVKAPVLLHIGGSDRRVVNIQGKTFYHALKARNVKVDMFEFKGEGHPLEGVEARRVRWESTVDWFRDAAA